MHSCRKRDMSGALFYHKKSGNVSPTPFLPHVSTWGKKGGFAQKRKKSTLIDPIV